MKEVWMNSRKKRWVEGLTIRWIKEFKEGERKDFMDGLMHYKQHFRRCKS